MKFSKNIKRLCINIEGVEVDIERVRNSELYTIWITSLDVNFKNIPAGYRLRTGPHIEESVCGNDWWVSNLPVCKNHFDNGDELSYDQICCILEAIEKGVPKLKEAQQKEKENTDSKLIKIGRMTIKVENLGNEKCKLSIIDMLSLLELPTRYIYNDNDVVAYRCVNNKYVIHDRDSTVKINGKSEFDIDGEVFSLKNAARIIYLLDKAAKHLDRAMKPVFNKIYDIEITIFPVYGEGDKVKMQIEGMKRFFELPPNYIKNGPCCYWGPGNCINIVDSSGERFKAYGIKNNMNGSIDLSKPIPASAAGRIMQNIRICEERRVKLLKISQRPVNQDDYFIRVGI